jgi:hypothetical protein
MHSLLDMKKGEFVGIGRGVQIEVFDLVEVEVHMRLDVRNRPSGVPICCHMSGYILTERLL